MVKALFALLLTLWIAALTRDQIDHWIDTTQLPVTLHETSVEMRDRNGDLLRVFPVADGLIRLPVTPAAVDTEFIRILLAYEDKRYYAHNGVDPLALTRAAGQALWHGRMISGGSTLTMQVARLLEDGPTGRWSGKLRQMRVALALERRLSKDQILQLYLTHAPYGGNLEGIRAASLAWFGKEPARLTAPQAALLVALPQVPERRRPDRHAQAAKDARDRVLTRLNISTPPEPIPTRMRAFPRLAPHLTDRVHADAPLKPRHDLTLDAGLQSRLETLVRSAAQSAPDRISAALIVADHQSGEILASIGSPGYSDRNQRQGFVDMTQAIRSPGSTLKPLIYALAFDQGLAHPETIIHDGPVQFGRYAPQNFDGHFRGDVRIRDALQLSLNTPVVTLTNDLGPPRVMAALHRSGTKPQLPGGKPGLAIALGGIGLSLQDLVQLYAGLAQGGHGMTLSHADQKVPLTPVVSATAAWHITDILRGLAPPPGAPSRAVAYKTGTSYGHRDAWAIGYDGQHVIGVWMGRADGTPVPGAFGGDIAAPVLFDAFGLLKPGFDPHPPPPSSALILGTAALPRHLQRYEPRAGTKTEMRDPPRLVFPPNGARLVLKDPTLTLKLRGGRPPFAVIANGQPVLTGARQRELQIAAPGLGYSTVTVVDRSGQSHSVGFAMDAP